MRKNYVIDSNILIDDPSCIVRLRNGEENNIFIPNTVIEEIDKLKDKKPQLKRRIFEIIDELETHKDEITILHPKNNNYYESSDNRIINEIQSNEWSNLPVFITNDRLLKFKAYKNGIETENYKSSIPFKQESEEYTGFVEPYTEEKINNCFYWDQGKLNFYSKNYSYPINYENSPWKVKPKDHYQNCFMDLVLNDDIDLITVQSEAGKGKSFIALASAFHLVFQKNTTEIPYEKIYIVKSNYEIGNEMGFLPGPVEEKMYPYFKPMLELITKLTKNRNLPARCFNEKNTYGLNSEFIEFLPINYLRGMNLENCVVIIEEIQNLSKSDARSLLTRMANNVKCICTGDINQIDNPYLTTSNNAMNWVVKLFKGEQNYAHIVLKGKSTRGPICKLVIDKGL